MHQDRCIHCFAFPNGVPKERVERAATKLLMYKRNWPRRRVFTLVQNFTMLALLTFCKNRHVSAFGWTSGNLSVINSARWCSSRIDDHYSEPDYSKLPRLYVGPEPALVRFPPRPGAHDTPRTPLSSLSPNALLALSPEQSHHVTTVLRMDKRNKAAQIRVFDGVGGEWLANLEQMHRLDGTGGRRRSRASSDPVIGTCTESLRSQTSTPTVWLCVAPPKKKDRTRWMIEKTTELNVGGYVWLQTDYSQSVDLRGNKLQAHVMEAAEQCERLHLPFFGSPTEQDDVGCTTPLRMFLSLWKDPENEVKLLVCRERSSSQSIWNALGRTQSSRTGVTTPIALLVGPEGGWSRDEELLLDELEQLNPDAIFNISLGPTVLRAETAAITAVAAYTLFQDSLPKAQD
jgi:16S rRNA (uracil1498-N3)-methyltransferase